MAEKYTVAEVREWKQDNHGNNVFYVDTENGVMDAYYATKGSAPVVGQEYEWELSQSDKGPRFRNPQKEGYENAGRPSGGGKRSGGGGYKEDPIKDRKITRLAVQKIAADIFSPVEKWDEFVNLCDTLCEDAFEYANKGQPAPAAAAPVPDVAAMGKQFQAMLKEKGIPVSYGVDALKEMHNREKLEATDNLQALVDKAEDLSVPF